MQNQNEDTEWNDALRRHKIIPDKEAEITEETITSMLEEAIKKKTEGKAVEDMTLDELDEAEDDEDERVLEQYRQKRILEMQAFQRRARYGSLVQISSPDFIQEVNKAGDGVWVVVHLFQSGFPLCERLNFYLTQLAAKFPTHKFLKIVSTNCIQNYPDKNLPTMLVYRNGELVKQIVTLASMGGPQTTVDDVEWALKQVGLCEGSTLERNPREKDAVRDIMMSSVSRANDSDDDDYD